jgi:hypothetical protein
MMTASGAMLAFSAVGDGRVEPDGELAIKPLDGRHRKAPLAQAQPHAKPQPGPQRRKPEGTKVAEARDFLRLWLNRGPMNALDLQARAREQGLLKPGQEIGKNPAFRAAKRQLEIESHRKGFGLGASYTWRFKPPEWTRGPDIGGRGMDDDDGRP